MVRSDYPEHDDAALDQGQAAQRSLACGNTTAACNQLQALIDKAQEQSGEELTAAQATAIVTAAQAVRTALS